LRRPSLGSAVDEEGATRGRGGGVRGEEAVEGDEVRGV